MIRKCAAVVFFVLAGCCQSGCEDDDLRIVPVTNNPYVVPSHGGGLPGTSTATAGGPK